MRVYFIYGEIQYDNAFSVSTTINLPRGDKNHRDLEFWRMYSLINLYKHSSNIKYNFLNFLISKTIPIVTSYINEGICHL